MFPWKILANNGIGLWPKMEKTRTEPQELTWKTFQVMAQELGYGIVLTGLLDTKTEHVFNEFMRHYFPEQCMGRDKNLPKPELNESIILCLENLIDRHCIGIIQEQSMSHNKSSLRR